MAGTDRKQPMKSVNVLVIQRLAAADHARIKAIDPAINLIDAGGWFDGEYRDTWPAYSAARYLSPNSTGQGSREQRDKLLAESEVILGGWPFPLDLRARAPQPTPARRALAAGLQRTGRRRRARPAVARQRFCRDLLPMDAGNDAPLQQGPLRADEEGQCAGQCRARRDRR